MDARLVNEAKDAVESFTVKVELATSVRRPPTLRLPLAETFRAGVVAAVKSKAPPNSAVPPTILIAPRPAAATTSLSMVNLEISGPPITLVGRKAVAPNPR